MGKKIEATKNKMRENIIAKQKMCQQKKPFQRFVPEFDPLLEKFPKWEIPKQYSLKTILISILTLQNMGIMQCSLLGIFEDTAPTTKVMSLAAFIAIPCGYILYVYITLRGAMKPTMKTKKGKVVPVTRVQLPSADAPIVEACHYSTGIKSKPKKSQVPGMDGSRIRIGAVVQLGVN